MALVKRVLTYEEVTDPEQVSALGVDPVMLPPDAVVVRCIETGAFEEVFYDRDTFNSKYELED